MSIRAEETSLPMIVRLRIAGERREMSESYAQLRAYIRCGIFRRNDKIHGRHRRMMSYPAAH